MIHDPNAGAALHEVYAELERQYEKWGPQNHPNGTGPNSILYFVEESRDSSAVQMLRSCRAANERAVEAGKLTWSLILLEEVLEAQMESDPQRLHEELIQVAAVAVQWALKIKRTGR